MLEHVITHPVHHAIMCDMNDSFGPRNNARIHVILAQMMNDLGRTYGHTCGNAAL